MRVGERSCEHAGLLVPLGLPLDLGLRDGGSTVGGDRGGRVGVPAGPRVLHSVGPRGCGQCIDQRMLRSDHHERRPEYRVRPRREHVEDIVVTVRRDDRKAHRRARAPADPVALHGLDLVRPLDPLEIVDQTVGVRRDAHHPLAQVALEDGEVAALAPPFRGHLLVGDHRAQTRAPVDRRIRHVRQAVRVDDSPAFDVVQFRPDAAVRSRPPAGLEGRHQIGDRAGPSPPAVGLVVVPRPEDLQEDPLGPPHVAGIGGRERPTLVVRKPQAPQLAAHVGHVGFGRDARMLTGLHGVLLRRQAECVVRKRVQHVVAAHAPVPAQHVRGDVSERMPDVQSLPRGVREHVHEKELGPAGDVARQRAGRVGGLERALGLPAVLPARLDLGGQHAGVPVRRGCIGAIAGRGGDRGGGLGLAHRVSSSLALVVGPGRKWKDPSHRRGPPR